MADASKIVGYKIKTPTRSFPFKGHKRRPVDKKWEELINDERIKGDTIRLFSVYGDGYEALVKSRTIKPK